MIASAANKNSSSADYQLGPEDMLQVTIYNLQGIDAGISQRDVQVRVSQQGMIKLPLLGQLKVGGLTSSDLETLLQKRYGEFIHDPEIAVFVREFRSQRVSVIGAVNKAGVIDLTGPKTLIDILSMAGGVNDRAGNQVHVYRQNSDGRES
jgi:polysaccharide export outer membrane protein